MGLLLKVLRFGPSLGTADGERDDRSRRTAGTECEGSFDVNCDQQAWGTLQRHEVPSAWILLLLLLLLLFFFNAGI